MDRAPSELEVRGLEVNHHAGLYHVLAAGGEQRGIVDFGPDTVPDVLAAVIPDPGFAHHLDRRFEDLLGRHPGSDERDPVVFALERSGVVAAELLRRLAENVD